MSDVNELIKKHGQPNFMIGIGYVRAFADDQKKKIEELEKKLAEAMEVIKHYSSWNLTLMGLNKSPCVADDFLKTLEEEGGE